MNLPEEDFISIEELNFYKQLYENNCEVSIEKDEAIPLPNSKRPGYSAIYRNKWAIDNNNGEVINYLSPNLNTVDAFWKVATNLFGNQNCLGKFDESVNDYKYEKYFEINKRKTNVANGIIQLTSNHKIFNNQELLTEIYPKNHKNQFVVAIFSSNKPEWSITDIACQHYSICTTTLYDNLNDDVCHYILSLLKCPIIFTTKDKLLQILNIKKKNSLNSLLIIICFDKLNFDDDWYYFKISNEIGIDLYDFNHLESLGKINPPSINSLSLSPTPETPYTICFTSGTTGVSKGVYITHHNMATSLAFCFHHWPRPILENDSVQLKSYCLLPLAHIYERQTTIYSMISGIAVGFPSSNIDRIKDCQILKPNYLQAVPRIYNKIEKELKLIIDKNPFLRKFINLKFELIKNNQKLKINKFEFNHLDMIITNKLRKSQGLENVKICLSASAPISLITETFLCTVLNLGFIQNYGASEVTSACTAEYPFRDRINNTGQELIIDGKKSLVSCSGVTGVTIDLKLKDLPELNYFSKKNQGEVLFSGPQVFEKYVFAKELTAKSFEVDEHGKKWYRTGDICEIIDGKLFIIDRVKNFFKLSQGEFLSPERIENGYLNNISWVNQCFIHGYGDKDYPVGIVGIVIPELLNVLIANNLSIPNDLIELIKDFESSLTQKQISDAQEIELVEIQSIQIKKVIKKLNSQPLQSQLVRLVNQLVKKDDGIKFAKYELLGNIYFDFYPLNIKNGVLTPTLKLQRIQGIKRYKQTFQKLYDTNEFSKL